MPQSDHADDGDFLDEEDELLLDERDRVDARPAPEDLDVPGLSCLRIEVDGPVEAYAARLRAVLGAALDRSLHEAGIDPDSEPRPVPDWFAAVCEQPDTAPEFARSGAERYTAAGNGAGWDLAGWLDEFDADEERAWSWWDLTRAAGPALSLWVDAGGEDAFPSQELRWAAYTAGATAVAPPALLRARAWQEEESL